MMMSSLFRVARIIRVVQEDHDTMFSTNIPNVTLGKRGVTLPLLPQLAFH